MPVAPSGRIAVRCACGAKLAAPLAAAGRSIKCPKCHESLPIPDLTSVGSQAGVAPSSSHIDVPPPAPAPAARISVRCSSCGVRMKVPATAVGRRAKCPKCGQTFVIADPAATQIEAPEGSSVGAPSETAGPSDTDELSGSRSLIDDLAMQEQSASAIAGAPSAAAAQRPCPSCNAMMSADAILCVACGYNTQTGRIEKASTGGGGILSRVREIDGLGIVSGLARAAGPLVAGCVLSAIGAAIGAALWSVIAIKSGYEIGWIAWIVGGLAGVGMHIGFREESAVAGGIAALMSVLSIVAAKVVIFAFAIVAIVGAFGGDDEDTDKVADGAKATKVSTAFDTDIKRLRVAVHRAERIATQKGLAPWDEQRSKLVDQEEKKCKAMSAAALDQAIKEIEAWEKGGKWDDKEYVRNYLIYAYARQAIRAQQAKDDKAGADEAIDEDDEDFEDPDSMPSKEEWKKIHSAAVAKADAIPTDQRSAKAQEMEAERERRAKEALAKIEAGGEDSNGDGAAGAAASFFFKVMFSPIDIVFFVLAIATAYRIGGKGVSIGET